jgi:polar amino acid transport system substrate-binding protein
MNPSRRNLFAATLVLPLAFAGCAVAPPAPSARAVSELAPGGKLRVALFAGNPVVVNQPAAADNAQLTGVGLDLGKALAQRLGAAFEPVRYTTATALLADARTGKWDVALLGIEATRMADMDFTKPYATIENTYLVAPNSALMAVRDVDRKGIKVGVSDRTVQHSTLKAQLKEATLTAVAAGQVPKELSEGRIDAYAGNRRTLEEIASTMPGYRLLPGKFVDVKFAIGVPKGRSTGAAYADEFVREMVASGALAESIARHKVRNFNVAN